MTTPLPVLPQIIVEAGLAADTPSQPTAFLLNDATYGKLDSGTLGSSISWSDISDFVISFTVSRPSTRLAGPLWNYQAGTVSILLDNSGGQFDPDNLAGPYVTGGVTELQAMVPVRVRANFGADAYALFSGFADGWLPSLVTYEGGYAELTLPATDALKVLAGITLAPVSIEGTGATTGARMTDILARAGWYTSADRNVISTGNSTLLGTTLGDYALNLMQIAADSEIGQLYVNGAGAVVFRARHDLLTDTRSNTVQAVFGDLPGTSHTAGTELAVAAVGRASDDTTIANDVQATRIGGALQEVKDTASIAKYLFPRTYARSDLILQDDPTTLNWAEWVLYIAKGGEDRIEQLQIDPQADPYNLWPQVLGREIGDRIQVWHRPASVATPISKDCFIAGISHAWDSIASIWLTTWTLQDASKYGSFLTLDNATLGQLGSNALAFLQGDCMAVPTWVVGQVLTASDVNTWLVPNAVYKTANTNRTSGSLTIDPDLQFTLTTSAFYEVKGAILYTATAGIGFAWAWTAPAGSGGGFGAAWNQSGAGAENQGYAWSTGTLTGGTPGTTQSIVIDGFISTGGTGGTFGLNWASGTGGSSATCGLGSKLSIQRIG